MINIKNSIIDLRCGGLLNKKADSLSTEDFSSLKVGSIFIDSDGTAKKVTSIIEEDGDTIIETTKPRMEEVMDGLYIPQQEISLGYENIIPESIAEGVTITPGVNNFGTKGDITNPDYAVGIKISLAQVLKTKKLEDTSWEVYDKEMVENSDEGINTIRERNADKLFDDEVPEKDITIIGTLKMKDMGVNVGAAMPYIKTEWVRRWWGGYPRFVQKSGYVNYQYKYKMEKSIYIEGSTKIEGEKKILLYGVNVPGGKLASASLGVFMKINAVGSVTIGWEMYDYKDVVNGSSADIVFSSTLFSLRNVSKYSITNKSIQRESMAGTFAADLKVGPTIEFELEALGFELAAAEAAMGVGLYAEGCVETVASEYIDGVKQPKAEPVYDGYIEGYAYFTINAELLNGAASFDILDYKKTLFTFK